MILIGIIASAMVMGMFWNPKPEGIDLDKLLKDPIAETKLENDTITIYLGNLCLPVLGAIIARYKNTPIYQMLCDYRDGHIDALKERMRSEYYSKLNSLGYTRELLDPLGMETLQRMAADLK